MASRLVSSTPMSANNFTAPALGFSHRLVPFNLRLSPPPLTAISLGTSISSAPVTIRCSSTLSIPSTVDEETEKFVEASKHRNLIPLHRYIFSDQLTPVLAYRCLVKEDDR